MTRAELQAAKELVYGQPSRTVADDLARIIVLAVREGAAINQTGATWEDVTIMVRAELYKL